MSTRPYDAPQHLLDRDAPSPSCAEGITTPQPLVNPCASRPRNARGLVHRPGPGCPCGCTFDSQTRRCIEPWNPPADGNDLGPLFFG